MESPALLCFPKQEGNQQAELIPANSDFNHTNLCHEVNLRYEPAEKRKCYWNSRSFLIALRKRSKFRDTRAFWIRRWWSEIHRAGLLLVLPGCTANAFPLRVRQWLPDQGYSQVTGPWPSGNFKGQGTCG